MRFTGKIIVSRVYDCGLSANISVATDALRSQGIKVTPSTTVSKKRLAPKYARPEFDVMFSFPSQKIVFGGQPIRPKVVVGLREEGTVTIQVIIPFEGARADDLIKKSLIDEGILETADGQVSFNSWVAQIYGKVMNIIRKGVSVRQKYGESEAPAEEYTYIVISKTRPKRSARWLIENRRKLLAGLLRPWGGWRELSESEVRDATVGTVQYTKNDIVIIDWARALIIGATPDVERGAITTIDTALTQRVKLRRYDAILNTIRSKLRDPKIYSFSRALLPPSVSPIPEVVVIRSEISDLFRGLHLMSVWAEESYLGRIYSVASQKLRLQDLMNEVHDCIKSTAEDISTVVQLRTTYWVEVLFILVILAVWLVEIFFK